MDLDNIPYIIDPRTDCWNWPYKLTKEGKGYAYAWDNETHKGVRVHIRNYEKKYGKVPDELQLDHFKCDNKGCCNPDHVKPVTGLENTLRGKQTKLTQEQVKEIIDRVEQNPRIRLDDLAKEYGVTQPAITITLQKTLARCKEFRSEGKGVYRKLRCDGKLVHADKIKILELYKTTNLTQRQIGDMFGVSNQYISSMMKKYYEGIF